jgi:CMP-N,N'-diacetyllegionaminic acid synthase
MWAIVPARSGSKGFPSKNTSCLAGIPLLAHSINFARKLSFVDKVILSTDSDEYADIGKHYGAEVPFLRSAIASADTAMEEDILHDIKLQCEQLDLIPPNDVLWLRPTHPLREIATFEKAYAKFKDGPYSSICVVTEEDPRMFRANGDVLAPSIAEFKYKSMVRRQDCPAAYRIFGGEFFKFPHQYNPQFLGSRIGFEVAHKSCKFDIDYAEDLEYLSHMLNTPRGQGIYGPLLHSKV